MRKKQANHIPHEPVIKPKQRQYDPITDDPSDWVGRRPNTKAEQKIIDARMKKFLEDHPNFTFWKDHPEYVDKYLSEIDLKELGFNDNNELPK